MKTKFLAACLYAACVTFAAQGRAEAREGKALDEKALDEKLISCVVAGDAECVRHLLAGGARPDAADERGRAALILASEGRSVAVVRLLLGAGADANKAREGEGKPLCRAALFGRREIAELLLERGAKVDVVCDGDHGDTPLMVALAAAMLGGMPDDLKEELFGAEGGGDEEDGDAEPAGGPPERARLRGARRSAPAEDFLAIARTLLARGADVNVVAKCSAGETALMYAAMGANVEMVKALLSRRADIKKGAPVLAFLSQADGEHEKAKRLALPAISKEQAAMLAWTEKTRAARAEIIRLLRAAGAEEVKTKEGREDKRSEAKVLEDAADEAFYSVIEKDDVKELARLVAAYSAHPLGKRALTEALRLAIIRSRDEMVRLLIERGVDPNPADDAPRGYTPLMHAAQDGKLEYVRMLLDAGADVNRRNADGLTALDAALYAAANRGGTAEEPNAIVELLKARGAKSARRE